MLGWFGFEYGWGYDKYKKAAFSSETIKVEIYLVFKCCLKLLFLRSDGQLVCPIELLILAKENLVSQIACVILETVGVVSFPYKHIKYQIQLEYSRFRLNELCNKSWIFSVKDPITV